MSNVRGARDALRERLIASMAQRAANRDGKARELLDARLSALIEERDAARTLDVEAKATSIDDDPKPANRALRELADRLAAREARPSPADLLDDLRKIWTRVRTESQLRESLDHVPQNAGPLNSSSLVHRSLSLMRELSPGYLQHFLSYVDALSWLDQLASADAPAHKEAPRAASAKKSTRAKAR